MIGRTVSHYKILEKLGGGGMGVVYKAEDTQLKRIVALKFLPPELIRDDDAKQRFIQEAQAASALDHPNICTIYEIGETEDGQMFIAMAYYDGETVKKKIERGPMQMAEALDLAMQIANGLSKAHEKEIIHRDIKPANVMVTNDGVAKIVDFGLAKAARGTVLTKEGTSMGTAAYMSPEQTQGFTVDNRADIWALGAVLYEMLTGQLPFKGDYEQAIIYSLLNEEPEPMADVAPKVEQIVMKALAKNPDDRYQTADEVASDLRAIADEQSGRIKTVVKQRKLPWMIAAAMVVVVAAALYILMPLSKPAKASVKTIAVLPFADRSPNKDQEYFSDGLAEELLNVLARNPGLRVTSRTSAFSFKGKDVDIRTIAEKLNVKHILEGSVRKAGKTLRITAQLIDVDTDAHLWSKTYDGTLDNIFAVQYTIARSVAEALQVTLLGGKTPAHQAETSPEAYNAYLQGKHFYKLRDKENLEKAISYYEQALSIDPDYATAWVGLSSAHTRQAGGGYLPVDEGYRKARQEVEKALTLDPNLARAHAQMGWIKMSYDWDWSGADESYRRALELEPGNAGVVSGAASLAATLGRFEEAMALDRRAIEHNPISTVLRFKHGCHAYSAGFLEEAEAAFRKALELNPQYPQPHVHIGLVYLAKGNPDSALAETERESHPAWRKIGQALAYHALGKKKEADNALAAIIKEYQNEAAYQIAEIYAYRGEKDKAFEWLERAFDQRDPGLSQMKGSLLLRNIEKDPRYTAFLKKMNLPL